MFLGNHISSSTQRVLTKNHDLWTSGLRSLFVLYPFILSDRPFLLISFPPFHPVRPFEDLPFFAVVGSKQSHLRRYVYIAPSEHVNIGEDAEAVRGDGNSLVEKFDIQMGQRVRDRGWT